MWKYKTFIVHVPFCSSSTFLPSHILFSNLPFPPSPTSRLSLSLSISEFRRFYAQNFDCFWDARSHTGRHRHSILHWFSAAESMHLAFLQLYDTAAALWHTSIQNSHQLHLRQRQTALMRMWPIDHGRWAGIKSRKPATNLSFNTPSSTVCCHIDYFSLRSRFQKTPDEDEQSRPPCKTTDCSKQSLNDVIFIS